MRFFSYCTRWVKGPARVGTVRFMFPALVTFAAMLTAAVVTSIDTSYVRLAISDEVVQAGSRFSVDVYAYAHVPVNAIDITLHFDPSAVEVLGVDTGQSVLTIWTKEPTIENDRVVLQGGTYRKGFVREHKIATINLKAKQTGQSTVDTTRAVLLAGDGVGSPVTVADTDTSSASLYIYDENSNPDRIGVDVAVNIVTDIDGDGDVTLKDVSAFMAAWATKKQLYDFNGDGRMTFRDFSIILANFFF